MKHAFVILHYIALEDTIECVNSIINNLSVPNNDEKYIIIVDNGSPNSSFEKLNEVFGEDRNIILIKSDENLGFARGNNLGFMYAKNKLAADFIIMINNDTIIYQNDFLEHINCLYKKYNFAVLGPNITTADGMHQNPFLPCKWTINRLRLTRLKQKIKYCLTLIGLDRLFLKEYELDRKESIKHDIIGASLHGACLIFSKNYINILNGLCDKTFLYMEEEMLDLYIKKYNLISVYSPTINIYHKEDVATKSAQKSSLKRKLNKYKYWIESSYEYEKLLRKFNEVK